MYTNITQISLEVLRTVKFHYWLLNLSVIKTINFQSGNSQFQSILVSLLRPTY